MKQIDGKTVLSVFEVNSSARNVLENMVFWVEGEISSFKGLNERYRYIYFDLKDPQTETKLPCVLEPTIYKRLNFEFENGKKVLALGNLTLWEKEAKFQMFLHNVKDFGFGNLLASLEQLKNKLEKKGYFAIENKKKLPEYPAHIAVITSAASDAWQDFKKHSLDKFGIIKAEFYDVMVQGHLSARQIAKSIKQADSEKLDAIVIIRGGGSQEDLSSFNDEKVAEAIFDAKTPVVVGVGHEKDVTIAQLTADVQASTPTDAAKIITANYVQVLEKLEYLNNKIKSTVKLSLFNSSRHLDLLFNKALFQKEKLTSLPDRLKFLKQSLDVTSDVLLAQNIKKIEKLKESLKFSWKYAAESKKFMLKSTYDKMQILSPEKTLNRGYAIVTTLENSIVRTSADIEIGDSLKLRFSKGKVVSKVTQKEDE